MIPDFLQNPGSRPGQVSRPGGSEPATPPGQPVEPGEFTRTLHDRKTSPSTADTGTDGTGTDQPGSGDRSAEPATTGQPPARPQKSATADRTDGPRTHPENPSPKDAVFRADESAATPTLPPSRQSTHTELTSTAASDAAVPSPDNSQDHRHTAAGHPAPDVRHSEPSPAESQEHPGADRQGVLDAGIHDVFRRSGGADDALAAKVLVDAFSTQIEGTTATDEGLEIDDDTIAATDDAESHGGAQEASSQTSDGISAVDVTHEGEPFILASLVSIAVAESAVLRQQQAGSDRVTTVDGPVPLPVTNGRQSTSGSNSTDSSADLTTADAGSGQMETPADASPVLRSLVAARSRSGASVRSPQTQGPGASIPPVLTDHGGTQIRNNPAPHTLTVDLPGNAGTTGRPGQTPQQSAPPTGSPQTAAAAEQPATPGAADAVPTADGPLSTGRQGATPGRHPSASIPSTPSDQPDSITDIPLPPLSTDAPATGSLRTPASTPSTSAERTDAAAPTAQETASTGEGSAGDGHDQPANSTQPENHADSSGAPATDSTPERPRVDTAIDADAAPGRTTPADRRANAASESVPESHEQNAARANATRDSSHGQQRTAHPVRSEATDPSAGRETRSNGPAATDINEQTGPVRPRSGESATPPRPQPLTASVGEHTPSIPTADRSATEHSVRPPQNPSSTERPTDAHEHEQFDRSNSQPETVGANAARHQRPESEPDPASRPTTGTETDAETLASDSSAAARSTNGQSTPEDASESIATASGETASPTSPDESRSRPAESSPATVVGTSTGPEGVVTGSGLETGPASTAPGSAVPDNQVLTPNIQRALSAIQSAATGDRHLRVQLNPAEIGSLQVDIVQTAQGIVARLEVTTPAAHQLLVDSLSDLQQSLIRNQSPVERIDVVLNESRTETSRQQRDQGQQRQGQQRDPSGQQQHQEQSERRRGDDPRTHPPDEESDGPQAQAA